MDRKIVFESQKKYRKNPLDADRKAAEEWYDSFDGLVGKVPMVPQGKLEQLWFLIEKRILRRRKILNRRFYFSAASVALLFLGVGGWLYTEMMPMEGRGDGKGRQEIFPAAGIPVLRLSDGRQVALDKSELIRESADVLIKNDSARVLDYSEVEGTEEEEIYNTVIVPVGGEYQVVLADGTNVRLNSCSRLTFPVSFNGEKRSVDLQGEAYFEVVKSSKPFEVNTSNFVVQVLGTSFNVSDYLEDSTATTTLLEGRVRVKDKKRQEGYDIMPSNTLVYRKGRETVMVQRDGVERYVAWLEGKFRFEGMRLEEIMRTLKRWYDCDIVYEDDRLKDLHYSGVVEKDRPVSYLLGMIEEVTDVGFEIEGNEIRMFWKR